MNFQSGVCVVMFSIGKLLDFIIILVILSFSSNKGFGFVLVPIGTFLLFQLLVLVHVILFNTSFYLNYFILSHLVFHQIPCFANLYHLIILIWNNAMLL